MLNFNRSLECHACCCSSEHSDTESDANNEMFSQGSDYSEIMGSEDVSSVPLQTIQQRVYTQEMVLSDNETDGENSTSKKSNSENLSHESPETANSEDSVSHCSQENSGISWEVANSNLHNPLSSCDTTPRILGDSLQTIKRSESNACSTAKKQIKFTPSRRDPRLQSSSYASHLFGTETSLTSHKRDTATQSTYFSNDPDIHRGSSKQIKNASHGIVHAEFTVQMDKPADIMPVNINSNDMSHTPSADTANNESISVITQNENGLNAHSKRARSNSESTTSVNENINELSKNLNFQSIFNQTKTSDLFHLTGSACSYASDISKKQATSSSAASGDGLMMNVQSSTQPPDSTCFKPLKINTNDKHKNQNVKKTEISTVMKNCDKTISPSTNIKKQRDISHSSTKNQTKHRAESVTKPMSHENGQPAQNASHPSVTSKNEKQVENFQQSLSKSQEFTAESQSSDHFGLTQSLLTQSEQRSFIFGIKRIQSHSATEFVPNYQLPEGFWMNKATSVPKDLLEALENW
jgi:hypothetical protein